MTSGATPPVDDLRMQTSDGFGALLELVAGGKYSRSSGFSAPEAPTLLAWVKSRQGEQATWATFWDLVDSVLPTDTRETVAAHDVGLYSAAVLLGHIEGVDYETPIPNGNGVRFGDVRTRGGAKRNEPKPTVRERNLDYTQHGAARKAFIIALCRPELPEDLNRQSPEVRAAALALADALESRVRAASSAPPHPRTPPDPSPDAPAVDADVDNSPSPAPERAPSAEGSAPTSTEDSKANAAGGRSKARRWVAAAVAVVGLVVAGWFGSRGIVTSPPGIGDATRANGATSSDADVIASAQKPSVDWVGGVFWVPLAVTLESLPPGDPDCGRPEVHAWLTQHGEYQAPTQVLVRNRSDKTSAWISDVTLHGEVRSPTPGYFVECYRGGHGGGSIDATALTAEATDGAIAHLPYTTPDYFAYQVDPTGMTSLSISLSGANEFEGSLTIETAEGTRDPYELPVTDDQSGSPFELIWRGGPAAQRTGVILASTDHAIHWWRGSESDRDDTLPTCGIPECMDIVTSVWGK